MIELMRQRISVREYQNRSIEPEKVALLQEALLRSPTSRNRRPWTFVFVSDKPTLEKLSTCKPHGASFIKEAAQAVVICADPERCDVWIEDCSIAATVLQLTAQSMGLGSCWVQIRKRKHDDTSAEEMVLNLLHLDRQLKVEAIITLGYPLEPFAERDLELHTEKILQWSGETA